MAPRAPQPAADRFTGFPAEAFEFYDGLAADPSKAYWEAHRAVYDDAVRAPLLALTHELADEFGTAHLFRPYRDVRFSRDKSPYKDHQGAFVETQDAVGYYVQVSGSGLMAAGGWYAPRSPQLARYRDAVEAPAGAELERIVAAARARGLALEGDVMKTRPRGISPDHPRLDLLRHRSLVGTRHWEAAEWMASRKALTEVRNAWRALRPLIDWLSAQVGPGDPEERRR